MVTILERPSARDRLLESKLKTVYEFNNLIIYTTPVVDSSLPAVAELVDPPGVVVISRTSPHRSAYSAHSLFSGIAILALSDHTRRKE